MRQHVELSLGQAVNTLQVANKIVTDNTKINFDKASIARHFFHIVSSNKADIQQLRLIGIDGMELVRVDVDDKNVIVLEDEFLQNKSSRYYVKEGLKLRQGKIYTSPLDLNIEFGVIEYPYRPTLRFVMPVYDDRVVLRGIVVLNFNANAMLSELDSIGSSSDADFWLLNRDGYWLYDRRYDREWGFMFENSSLTVGAMFPSLWSFLSTLSNEQPKLALLRENVGLINAMSLEYSPEKNKGSNDNIHTPWTVVAYHSPDVLNISNRALQLRYLGLLVIISLPALSLCIGFAVIFRRRQELVKKIATISESRKADAKFEMALDASPTPMIMVDQEQNIILANKEAIKLFEYDSAEEMLIPLTSLIPHQHKTKHIHLVEEFQLSPRRRRMAAVREVKALTHTGKEIAVEIGLNPIDTSEGIVTLASITNITHRKMLESQLAKSNRTMMLAINTAMIGVWSWQVGEDAMMWDERMYRIYNYPQRPSKPITYKEWRAKIHPDDLHRIDHVFEQALKNNDSHQYEFRAYSREGQLCWIRGGVVREVHGTQTRLVGINIDVTEERMSHQSIATINRELERRVTKRTDELQQVNRELEAFSYAVSHDLRTPLRSIDGFSNLLMKSLGDSLQEQDQEYLSRIRNAAQRMGELIDDMLTLSRITRADVVRKRVDLAAMAQSIFNNLSEVEPTRHVDFISPNFLYVNADSALMRIMLNNLINNAWKFSSKVDNAVIEIGSEIRNEGEVYFVRDNGAGFDMAYAEKLFSAFQRLHTTSEFAGNGIGLATVQRVVDKHGGKVWAEGEINKGATIYFTLP